MKRCIDCEFVVIKDSACTELSQPVGSDGKLYIDVDKLDKPNNCLLFKAKKRQEFPESKKE